MDVLWFLKQRTNFIRNYYFTAATPFRETIRKIKDEEEPFVPPYAEDEEPPFLDQWMDADTSLEILGATCISMLSATLKLYFSTWEGLLGVQCDSRYRKSFKKGFVSGYKDCFGGILDTDWSDCPADFAILEQIVLARNAAQHPADIAFMHMNHREGLAERFPSPVFVSDYEKRLLETGQQLWSELKLVVTEDALYGSIRQVELLAGWLEGRLMGVLFPSDLGLTQGVTQPEGTDESGGSQPMSLTLTVKPAKDVADYQRKSFEDLVLRDPQVQENGLSARIAAAYLLAFAYVGDRLCGVGAVKNNPGHQRTLARNAGVQLPRSKYWGEIGYLHVVDGYRELGLGRRLLEVLIEASAGKGLFATIQTKNERSRRLFEGRGFVRVGNSWPSSQVDDEVNLYIRHG